MLNLVTYRKGNLEVKSNNGLLDQFFNDSFWNDSYPVSRPKANVKEEKDRFIIELVAPGFTREQVNIELEKEVVTIKGKAVDKSEKNIRYTTHEFVAGEFVRRFAIPESVDAEKISAGFENGILVINLPKRDEKIDKGPRTIKIG